MRAALTTRTCDTMPSVTFSVSFDTEDDNKEERIALLVMAGWKASIFPMATMPTHMHMHKTFNVWSNRKFDILDIIICCCGDRCDFGLVSRIESVGGRRKVVLSFRKVCFVAG